jgi:hypothetical protein
MITTVIICDTCDDEGVPGLDRPAMLLFGWTYVGGLDLCPGCTESSFS